MSESGYRDEMLEQIFNSQVPFSGKADNLLGEIVRAWMRILYRWSNDGDQIGVGYGKETCNAAARFLFNHIGSLDFLQNLTDREDNGSEMTDEEYEKLLSRVTENVRRAVEEHYDSFAESETEDYDSHFISEYDSEKFEDEDEEDYYEEDYEEEEEYY